jgi:hypothetical protein
LLLQLLVQAERAGEMSQRLEKRRFDEKDADVREPFGAGTGASAQLGRMK